MSSVARRFVAAVLLTLLAAPGSAQLINGGAETGGLAPWVADLSGATTGNSSIIKSVTTQVQTAPPVFPAVGSRFFSFATQVAGPAGSFVRLSQTVPIVGTPPALALTGQIQTEFGDFGEARLELLDVGSTVVATEVLGAMVSDGVWASFFMDVDVPAAATQCRVTLTGTVQVGTAVNVFWDALVLGTSSWAKVGLGLAGTNGVPVIDGAGPLVAGEPLVLSLENARTNSSAWLVIGVSALNAPFKGGTLIPHPDILLPLPTGPLGALDLASTWPAGLPSGFSTWYQWWVQDPAAPVGLAASRGLLGTTP